MQDEDDPLVRAQVAHRGHRFAPVVDRVEGVPCCRELPQSVERDEPDLAVATKAVTADVDQDPVEPWLKPGAVAKGASGLPCPEQGLLGRVLGFGSIAQHESGQPVRPIHLGARHPEDPVAASAELAIH